MKATQLGERIPVRITSPLAAFFQDTANKRLLIDGRAVSRHKDLALGYLTESLTDPGMWVGWDVASPDFFRAQGGVIPSWVQARIDNVVNGVPENSVAVQIEYVLNDPFALARCAHTGQEFHFALWDGNQRDAALHSDYQGEIRFDWRTVLPSRIAHAAMAADRRRLPIM